ncbi:MAG: hypothetical protein WDA08_02290 [Weeksellaceae bacterium]|jgi:hypothetical protein
MKNLVFKILIFLIFSSCSSTEQFERQFKSFIKKSYPSQDVCFRSDLSNKVNLYVLTSFKKDNEYEFNLKDSLYTDFNSETNCDLIALSGKQGDSILLAAVYPYKKGIRYEIDEFNTRFESGKYFLCMRNVGIKCDSLTIYHSSPFVPPVEPEILNKVQKNKDSLNQAFDSIILKTTRQF